MRGTRNFVGAIEITYANNLSPRPQTDIRTED